MSAPRSGKEAEPARRVAIVQVDYRHPFNGRHAVGQNVARIAERNNLSGRVDCSVFPPLLPQRTSIR